MLYIVFNRNNKKLRHSFLLQPRDIPMTAISILHFSVDARTSILAISRSDGENRGKLLFPDNIYCRNTGICNPGS